MEDTNRENDISSLESYRLSQKKKMLITISILILFGILGIILTVIGCSRGFYDRYGEIDSFIIAGLFINILVFIFILTVFSFFNANYKKKITDKFQKYFLDMFYKEGYTFNFQQGIGFNVLNQSEILRTPDAYTSNNYFASQDQGINFVGCNYDMIFYHYYTDKDGNRHRTEAHFPGKFFEFTYPRSFNHYLVIMEKNANSEAYKVPNKKSLVEFESMDFNKRFRVYCDDQQFAFYVITPQVQLNLMKFDDTLQSYLILVIKENKLYLFMNNFKSKVKFSLFKKLDQSAIDLYAKELKLPIMLADDMDLDKEKFHNREI